LWIAWISLEIQKNGFPFFFEVFDPRKIENDPVWQQAWRNTYGALLEMQEKCKANGAKFLVVTLTSEPEIASYQYSQVLQTVLDERFHLDERTDYYDFKLPDRVMADFCREKGISLLQLNPLFADMRDEKNTDIQFHFSFDGHWNSRGHRAAAQAILDYLQLHLLPTCQFKN
jgi:hypothetical protein